MKIGINLDEEIVDLIDEQAKKDGHTNRSAVVRKALVSFFAGDVAFVASDEPQTDDDEGDARSDGDDR